MNTLDTCDAQIQALTDFFDELSQTHDRLPEFSPATAGEHDDDTPSVSSKLCASN
jgi:tRNA-dihydrouridine synthase B